MRPAWMTDLHVVVLERIEEADGPVRLDAFQTRASLDPLHDHDLADLRAVCEPLERNGLIATTAPDEYRLTSRGRQILAGTLSSETIEHT